MQRFKDRHVLVSGAASGMGRGVAEAMLSEGARVTAVDLADSPPAGPTDALEFRPGDVTDPDFLADTVAAAVARFGPMHHLVNAAGVLWFDSDRSALEMDLQVWRRVLDVNLTGAALTARHTAGHMADGGSMVHVSSTQCYRGDDRPQDAYQAAKAGVIALSKSLAIQLAPRRIRSNVLVPGPTRTPLQARWDTDDEGLRRTVAAIPLGRVGRVADMVGAITFLLSDEAGFITGTELVVDGGLLARP